MVAGRVHRVSKSRSTNVAGGTTMSQFEAFDQLTRALAEGRINRREFALRMVSIGGSATAVAAFLATKAGSARAQDTSATPTLVDGPTGGTLKLVLPTSVDLNPIGVRTIGAF